MLVSIVCMTTAQDTVHTLGLPDRYFSDVWVVGFDSNRTNTYRCDFSYFVASYHSMTQAFRKFSKDSLTIYGIAVSLEAEKDFHSAYYSPGAYEDTSFTDVYDYVRIYEAGSTEPVPLSEQLKVHMHVTPITYYIDFDIYSVHGNIRWPAYPMYERYFHEPVTVVDSFYVARDCHACRYSPTHSGTTMQIGLVFAIPDFNISDQPKQSTCFRSYHPNGYPSEFDTNNYWWNYSNNFVIYPLLFPIPPPQPSAGRDTINIGGDTTAVGDTVFVFDTTIFSDTTIIDDDTIVTYDTIITCDTILGIQDYGLLDRLTGVMPNPAAETARVVSSFGISRVAAYSMDGRRVADIKVPDNALSTTLDVGRWPTGTYILRIHTPMGIATKKLSVYR